MNYLDYQMARDLSWQVLLDERVSELPVLLPALSKRRSVYVRTYQQAASLIRLLSLEEDCKRSDGLSFSWEGEKWILFDATRPHARCRFTIAHELGHCLMHHQEMTGQKPYYRIDACADAVNAERQANTFAADLLAPARVLWGMGVQTPEEIASSCLISQSAAQVRLSRLNSLRLRDTQFRQTRGHGSFLSSPLERKVYEQFSAFLLAWQGRDTADRPALSNVQAPPRVPAPCLAKR